MSELKREATRPRHTYLVKPVAFFMLATAILIYFHVDPVFPKYDDGWYFLVSYSWLNGLGFTNYWVSPIHSTIFNWHGFTQPIVIALLSPCNTLACVEIGLGMLQVIYLLVWTVAVESLKPSPLLRICLYAIGLSVMLQFSARHELLASIEMTLLFIGFTALSRREQYPVRAILAGAVTGLVAVTDPAASILVGLSCAAAICSLRNHSANLSGIVAELCILSATAALSVAFCLTVIYPYTALDWISGIREMSVAIASRQDNQGFMNFMKYFFFSRFSPMLGVMFVPLGFAIIRTLNAADRSSWLATAITTITAILVIADLYWTSIRVPATYYNFNAIVPTLSLIVVAMVSSTPDRSVSKGVVILSLFIFASGCSIALGVIITDKAYFALQQNSLKAAISKTVHDALSRGQRVALDTPLIQAIDDITIMTRVKLLFIGRPGTSGDWPGDDTDIVLRSQTESGRLPDTPPGSVLIFNGFDQHSIHFYIKPESLNYAVYERN
jgi:hypothetical protein